MSELRKAWRKRMNEYSKKVRDNDVNRKEYLRNYRREWYREQRATNPEFIEKDKARQLARRAYPIKQPCEKCGSIENIEKHHPDYSNPLDIIWLCKSCHVEIT